MGRVELFTKAGRNLLREYHGRMNRVRTPRRDSRLWGFGWRGGGGGGGRGRDVGLHDMAGIAVGSFNYG